MAPVNPDPAMKHVARNDALDALRLFAVLLVIVLHVELIPDLSVGLAVVARLLGRWAVPFFFLLAGYYLGPGEQAILRKCPAQSARLLWLFGFASLLYVPMVILESGVRGGLPRILNPSTFVSGTHYHLWFLSSMFLGLQIIYAAYRFGLQRYLPAAAALITALALAAGSYSPLYGWNGLNTPQFDFARELLSVPLMWLGLAVSRRGRFLSLGASVLLATAGLLLQLLEAGFLYVHWGMDPLGHEFLLGTTPFALGMLGIGLALNWNHCRWIASWGRRFTLGIYIVHYWWATIVAAAIIGPLATRGVHVSSLVSVALIFALSLTSLMALERFYPPLNLLLNGRLDAVEPASAQT